VPRSPSSRPRPRRRGPRGGRGSRAAPLRPLDLYREIVAARAAALAVARGARAAPGRAGARWPRGASRPASRSSW
jgi:hypothetical protein